MFSDQLFPAGQIHHIIRYRFIFSVNFHPILSLTRSISVAAYLERARVYVGEWVNSVDVFSRAQKDWRGYIITEPATMSQEAAQRNERTANMLYFNMWPAPSVFISAVALNVQLLTAHLSAPRNIFIIAYAERESSIECE